MQLLADIQHSRCIADEFAVMVLRCSLVHLFGLSRNVHEETNRPPLSGIGAR
jgi:hypothetical protein